MVPAEAYYSLDDDTVRDALQADPWGHLQVLAARARHFDVPLVIDEVQRVPALGLAIKRIVDDNAAPGQFLLTGSANVFEMAQAMDSLAGRVQTLRMLPLSAAEILETAPCRLLDLLWEQGIAGLAQLPAPSPFDRDFAVDLVVRGGYPEIRGLDDDWRNERHLSYLDSVIERDAALLSPIRKPDVLRRLVNQLGARTAQELNVADLCAALGIRRETVLEWLDLLERLGIAARFGAWTGSAAGREVKAPKLHLTDTGCASALRGEDATSYELDATPQALGPMLETWMASELLKLVTFSTRRWQPWHWRRERREIDILLSAPGNRLVAVEVKAASQVHTEDARHLEWFLTEGPGRGAQGAGIIFYLGPRIVPVGPNTFALPLSVLWS